MSSPLGSYQSKVQQYTFWSPGRVEFAKFYLAKYESRCYFQAILVFDANS